MAPKPPAYLLDFAVYKPPEELKLNFKQAEERVAHWPLYRPEMHDFGAKVLQRSGLDPNGTYVYATLLGLQLACVLLLPRAPTPNRRPPPPTGRCHPAHLPPPPRLPKCINPLHTSDPSRQDVVKAMEEAEMVMGGVVEEVLAKTGLAPADIDILVTSSSIFCPTPSLSAMLVNKFKFRTDVQSYSLGGMGCAVGVAGLALMRDLLAANPNSRALFVPCEMVSYSMYVGSERAFLISDLIFRMGGSALLMPNRKEDIRRAKYQLTHHVRAHTGQDDGAYMAVNWTYDQAGYLGMNLQKDLTVHASKVLDQCIRAITPKIMTWAQYAQAGAALVQAKLTGTKFDYMPDYTQCADHFVLHAGGYAVIEKIRETLHLPAAAVLPSFAALNTYSNTSASTTWYALSMIESTGGLQRGQTVMQLGVGGGMKGSVAIWKALRTFRDVHPAWAHLADRPLTKAPRHRRAQGGGPGGAQRGTAAGPRHAPQRRAGGAAARGGTSGCEGSGASAGPAQAQKGPATGPAANGCSKVTLATAAPHMREVWEMQ